MDRVGHGTWLRALLRILVHRFSGRTTRHVCRLTHGGATYAAHSRLPEDALPRSRHSAGDDRVRPDGLGWCTSDTPQGRRGDAAIDRRAWTRRSGLRSRHALDAAALLPQWPARAWPHGVARVVHVGDG